MAEPIPPPPRGIPACAWCGAWCNLSMHRCVRVERQRYGFGEVYYRGQRVTGVGPIEIAVHLPAPRERRRP